MSKRSFSSSSLGDNITTVASNDMKKKTIAFVLGDLSLVKQKYQQQQYDEIIDVRILWSLHFRLNHSDTLDFIAWRLNVHLQQDNATLLRALLAMGEEGKTNMIYKYLLTKDHLLNERLAQVAEEYQKSMSKYPPNKLALAMAKREKLHVEKVMEYLITKDDSIVTDQVIKITDNKSDETKAILMIPRNEEESDEVINAISMVVTNIIRGNSQESLYNCITLPQINFDVVGAAASKSSKKSKIENNKSTSALNNDLINENPTQNSVLDSNPISQSTKTAASSKVEEDQLALVDVTIRLKFRKSMDGVEQEISDKVRNVLNKWGDTTIPIFMKRYINLHNDTLDLLILHHIQGDGFLGVYRSIFTRNENDILCSYEKSFNKLETCT